MKNKVVVIDRSKWRTGSYSQDSSGIGDTQLLNSEGFMCCLGFGIAQVGKVKKESLRGLSVPSSIDRVVSPFSRREKGQVLDTEFSDRCVVINDNTVTSRAKKEEKLQEEFAKHGIVLLFKGEYVDGESSLAKEKSENSQKPLDNLK